MHLLQGMTQQGSSLSFYRRIYTIKVIKHLLNVHAKTDQLLTEIPEIIQVGCTSLSVKFCSFLLLNQTSKRVRWFRLAQINAFVLKFFTPENKAFYFFVGVGDEDEVNFRHFQIPLQRPIFIVSLPRSGTTFLSRLLGQDPALLAPQLQHMMHPHRLWRPEPDSSVYQQTRLAFGENQQCLARVGVVSAECLVTSIAVSP